MAREERVGATEDREAARGRPPAPRRPLGPRRGRMIKLPEELTPRGDQDRPTERRCHVEAGPGQAARFHSATSGVHPLREGQAPPPLLLTTGATRNNHREPTLAHYK